MNPSTPSLALSLAEAHLDRAKAAQVDLAHASTAPALFKPEFVAQRIDDFGRSMFWSRYWQGQVAAR